MLTGFATPTTLSLRKNQPILRLPGARRQANRIVVIAAVAAAGFAANIADAAAANHHRYSGARPHKSNWVALYAQSDPARHGHAVSAPSYILPGPSGRGIFSEEVEKAP